MKRHAIKPRTIIVPIVFMLIHFAVSLFVMFGFSFFYSLLMALQSPEGAVINEYEMIEAIQTQYMEFIIIGYSLIQIVIYGIWLKIKQRKEYPIYVFNRRGRPSHWIASIVMILGCLGVTNLFFIWIQNLGSTFPFIDRMIQDYTDTMTVIATSRHWIVQVVYLAILVPIAEEMLFRGIIMAELKRAMPAWVAIIINGVLFAIFHMQPIQSVYVFIVGMVIAAAYIWSESFWVAVVMHMIFNFLGGVLPEMVSEESVVYTWVVLAQFGFAIIGIFVAVWFYLNRRHQEGDFFMTRRLSVRKQRRL